MLSTQNRWKGTATAGGTSVTCALTHAPVVGKNRFLVTAAQKSGEPSVVLKLIPPKGKTMSFDVERNEQGQPVIEAHLDSSGSWKAAVEVHNGKRRTAIVWFAFVVEGR